MEREQNEFLKVEKEGCIVGDENTEAQCVFRSFVLITEVLMVVHDN
jgi:hypothetical protein